MKHALIAVAAVGLLASSVWAESLGTRTLQKNVYKDIGNAYPSSWAHYSGQGYWATAGSAEDKLEAGYDYYVPKDYAFRCPNTGREIGPFPGESLTVQGGSGTFYIYSNEKAVLDFKHLTFENPMTIFSPVGNNGSSSVHVLLSRIVCDVDFENGSGKAGTVKMTPDANPGLGQSYSGKVTAASDLTFDICTASAFAYEDFRQFFWVKFLGDTSEFYAQAKVQSRSVLFLGENGLANAGTVTVMGDANPELSGALGSETPGPAVPVKSLSLGDGARLWIATSARGATAPFRVTDSFTQAGTVSVCLTNLPTTVSGEKTNYKLEILRVASGAGTLSKDDFTLRGYTASFGGDILDLPINCTGAFSVETDANNGDSVLYLTLTPIISCVQSQSGSQNWLDDAGWSDGLTPHDDAAYLVPAKMSPRHQDKTRYEFGGKSLTLCGGVFQQVAWAQNSYSAVFPRDGLILESGKFSLQYGDGTFGDQSCAVVSGRVTVVAAPGKMTVVCNNNRRKGLRFVSEAVGAAGTEIVLEGSANHDDPVDGNPRQAAMLVGFDGDNSQFFGSVIAATNTIFAAGDGSFPGQVTVKGCAANLKESGGVRAWEAGDVCALGSLVLEPNAIVDVMNDPTTGASGQIVVTDSLSYTGPVQVYLAKRPARSVHARYPVLTLKSGAEGDLDADDFTFAGFVSKETPYAGWTPELTVETANNGDRTLYLGFARPGMLLLVR